MVKLNNEYDDVESMGLVSSIFNFYIICNKKYSRDDDISSKIENIPFENMNVIFENMIKLSNCHNYDTNENSLTNQHYLKDIIIYDYLSSALKLSNSLIMPILLQDDIMVKMVSNVMHTFPELLKSNEKQILKINKNDMTKYQYIRHMINFYHVLFQTLNTKEQLLNTKNIQEKILNFGLKLFFNSKMPPGSECKALDILKVTLNKLNIKLIIENLSLKIENIYTKKNQIKIDYINFFEKNKLTTTKLKYPESNLISKYIIESLSVTWLSLLPLDLNSDDDNNELKLILKNETIEESRLPISQISLFIKPVNCMSSLSTGIDLNKDEICLSAYLMILTYMITNDILIMDSVELFVRLMKLFYVQDPDDEREKMWRITLARWHMAFLIDFITENNFNAFLNSNHIQKFITPVFF